MADKSEKYGVVMPMPLLDPLITQAEVDAIHEKFMESCREYGRRVATERNDAFWNAFLCEGAT